MEGSEYETLTLELSVRVADAMTDRWDGYMERMDHIVTHMQPGVPDIRWTELVWYPPIDLSDLVIGFA